MRDVFAAPPFVAGSAVAIGALAREVQLQFLTEAVVLCCPGGMVGIALAFGVPPIRRYKPKTALTF